MWWGNGLNLPDFSFSVLSSTTAPLTCGVPHASILAPIMFSLCLLLCGPKHKIHFSLFCRHKNWIDLVHSLLECFKYIKTWI